MCLPENKVKLEYLIEFGDWLPDPMMAVNENWEVIAWNSAMEKFTGLDRKNILGRSGKKLFIPFDSGKKHLLISIKADKSNNAEHCMHQTKKETTSFLCEAHHQGVKNGQGIHIWERVSFIYEKGRFIGAVETIHDITNLNSGQYCHIDSECKKLYEKLQESERKFEYLFNYASDAIFIHDLEGNFLEVNDVACKRLGYSKGELLRMGPKDIDTDEYAAQFPERINEIIKNGKAIFETAHKKSDGTVIPIEVSSKIIEFEGQKAVLSIARDITDRKEAERKLEKAMEKLRESEQKYRSIFETAASFIWIINKNGMIIDCNNQVQRVLGYTTQELIGRNTNEVIAPTHIFKARRSFVRLFKQGHKYNTELKMVRKNGEEIYVNINSAALKDQQGNYEKAICIINDVTEQKKIEEELKISNKKLKKNTQAIFKTIGRIVEFRDPYTAGHQQRVAELAAEIARQMKLPEEKVEGIYFAGLIHDVGKIYVPSEILTKPGRISDIEFEIIKKHPQIGNEILRDMDFSWDIADIVLQHHERIDGTGYPFGLKADEILIEAKILAVADVFEAMSSHRPYRPSLGKDAAIKELCDHSGTKYDEKVVRACLTVIKKIDF